MAAITSVPSASTFEALTEAYSPKVLVDNIFTGTPTLQLLKQNMVSAAGLGWTPTIEIDTEDGEWYTKGGQVTNPTTVTGEIATKAFFTYKYYRRKVLLEAQDTDGQGAQQLIDLMAAQVRNATKAMSKNLNDKAFDGDPTSNQMDSLNLLCSDSTWGGINPATSGYEVWKAHIMESTSGVSPSIENISKLNRSTQNTCGEKPDVTLVGESYWDVLRAQITENTYLLAKAAMANSQIVKWGFDSFWVDGVPVVSDRDCLGSAFVSGQSTRSAAAGYQAFSVNFKHAKLAYNARRSFKFDPDGWRRPDDYDRYLNFIYFWGTIGTDSRRSQGRIFNVDLTQAESSWSLGTVTLPGA